MTGHGDINEKIPELREVKSYEFKPTKEDIERVSKEIREDLGLGECDCMKPKIEIDIDEAIQILQWWGLSDVLYAGQELAAKLEDFVTQNQSKTAEIEGPDLVYCVDCKKVERCHDMEYILANPSHDVFCEDFESNDPKPEGVKVPSERSRSPSNQSSTPKCPSCNSDMVQEEGHEFGDPDGEQTGIVDHFHCTDCGQDFLKNGTKIVKHSETSLVELTQD